MDCGRNPISDPYRKHSGKTWRRRAITSAVAASAVTVTMTGAASASAYPAPASLHVSRDYTNSFQVAWNARPRTRYLVQVHNVRGAVIRSWVTNRDYANVGGVASGAKYTVRIRVNVAGAPLASVGVWTLTVGNELSGFARSLVGDRYELGATGPSAFDCSGLTQYVYRRYGKPIPRTAQQQYWAFRRESRAAARPGDLVFFHDNGNPASAVYHVGVYEGGDDMVAAADPGQGVVFQTWTWGGDTVTFGTVTH